MKKIYGCIIFIILIGIIASLIIARPQKVDKLDEIKVLDSYGNEIDNYSENKMPFTIKKQNDNQTIKVNGKKYEDGERFYETGEYKIEVSKGIMKKTSTIKIQDIDKENDDNIYNIYITTTTLPSFMAMLDISSKDNFHGFFWTQRTQSIDLEYLKNTKKDIKISQNLGILNNDEFKEKVVGEIKEYIKDVLNTNKDAYFNLYFEDYRFYLELELFGKIGLGDNRYTTYMYSDGTSSYTKEYSIGNSYIHKEFKIREENGYSDFEKEKANYDKLVTDLRSNKLKTNDMPGSFMVREENDEYNYDYLLISTLRDNVKYLLQFPQLIDFKDEKVANEMKKANFVQIDLKNQYNNLNEEQKKQFLASIKLEKSALDQQYFSDANKKYLVITGTKPYYKEMDKKDFENLLNKVNNDYKDEYEILYKPHPSALPDEEATDFLESLGIKILPGTIPMEAIMFIYPNIKLGGFASSLYMSAEKGQTEFFFANNSNELVKPLNILYDSLFSNAKFYN